MSISIDSHNCIYYSCGDGLRFLTINYYSNLYLLFVYIYIVQSYYIIYKQIKFKLQLDQKNKDYYINTT